MKLLLLWFELEKSFAAGRWNENNEKILISSSGWVQKSIFQLISECGEGENGKLYFQCFFFSESCFSFAGPTPMERHSAVNLFAFCRKAEQNCTERDLCCCTSDKSKSTRETSELDSCQLSQPSLGASPEKRNVSPENMKRRHVSMQICGFWHCFRSDAFQFKFTTNENCH